MNKDKFNRLDVLEQINYINTQLDNSSLTSICKNIGISRSTIRDRFKKLDYSYSKELNRYIYNQSVTDVSQDIENQNNGCVIEDIHKENNISTTDVLQGNTVMSIINKSDEDIRNNLLDIVNNYDVLKEIIELHRRNTSVIRQQIIIDVEESESKLVTLRVNSKELELFNKFCDDNKQYKKIDLISQALKEFRERYK